MDNAVDAIIMAFSVFVFVIALTMSMYMFSQISSTSEILLYYSDKTNYYDNIEIATNTLEQTTRTVGTETIIPTLYRYYKENFCVKICDVDGTLIQIFDVNIEGKVRKAVATLDTKRSSEQKSLIKLYGPESEYTNLFEAPWIGNTDTYTKARIDFYINGVEGYINNTKVEYKNNLFHKAVEKDVKFTESFIEYAFSGDTITVGEGDATETITGNKQENSKIVITYTAQKDLKNL